VPNSEEDRLLLAIDTGYFNYYSINSTLSLSLISTYNEQYAVRAVQYNPVDASRFVSVLTWGGIRTYTISNDVITAQNLLSLNYGLVVLRFFGSGSYVAAVQSTGMTIATISGNSISHNFDYWISEATYCNGLAIVNDYDAFVTCVGGIFHYRLSAFQI
jgi:hypothetical protein